MLWNTEIFTGLGGLIVVVVRLSFCLLTDLYI